MSTQASKDLQTFPNPAPRRDFHIHMEIPEFTCLCPMTGQPDFAHIVIDYIPNGWLVESKSLKLYLHSFRNHGAFHEDCTIDIGISSRTETTSAQIRIFSGPTRSPSFPSRGALSSAATPGTEAISPLINAILLTLPARSRT